MATKKLKVEVELETAKAKRQAAELEHPSGGGGAPVAPPASGGGSVSDGLDKVSKASKQLADTTGRVNGEMLHLVRGLTGMAAGLAANYAAGYLRQGSAGREALEYGGSAVAGASMGASLGKFLGPYGAAAGAVIGGGAGLAKTFLGKDSANAAILEDYARGEKEYAETKDWADKFKSLTNVSKDFSDFAARTAEIETAIKQLTHAEKMAKVEIEEAMKVRRGQSVDEKRLAEQQAELAKTRQKRDALAERLSSLRDAKKDFDENERKKLEGRIGAIRTSTSATDALSRIGGSFGGGGDYRRELVSKANEQIGELKKIAENTKSKGAATWA